MTGCPLIEQVQKASFSWSVEKKIKVKNTKMGLQMYLSSQWYSWVSDNKCTCTFTVFSLSNVHMLILSNFLCYTWLVYSCNSLILMPPLQWPQAFCFQVGQLSHYCEQDIIHFSHNSGKERGDGLLRLFHYYFIGDCYFGVQLEPLSLSLLYSSVKIVSKWRQYVTLNYSPSTSMSI